MHNGLDGPLNLHDNDKTETKQTFLRLTTPFNIHLITYARSDMDNLETMK